MQQKKKQEKGFVGQQRITIGQQRTTNTNNCLSKEIVIVDRWDV
jgi:hypothetical protein